MDMMQLVYDRYRMCDVRIGLVVGFGAIGEIGCFYFWWNRGGCDIMTVVRQGKQKTGKIIPNGVRLEQHEYDTVLYFTELGKDVELIKPSYTPGKRNADFWMDGMEWEMKAPKVNSRKAIERMFYRGDRQSSNLVMDLRNLKGNDGEAAKCLEKCFNSTRRVRRMYILSKEGKNKLYQK